MSLKLPQIIGHRGCAGYAVENSLEAIYTAADMGINWVELDVKLTKDGVPIIFHDDTLERMTNGEGAVAEKTLAELKELDLAGLYSESYSSLKIPTLEEALDVLLERDMGLNLEIKPCPGREVETAEIALDLLSHCWDNHDELLISSFSHVSLETAFDMADGWCRGLLLEGEEWPENWGDIAQHLDVSTIHIDGNAATDEQILSALHYGKPVVAYTINDPALAHELQKAGVRTLISDEPDIIQDGILTLH